MIVKLKSLKYCTFILLTTIGLFFSGPNTHARTQDDGIQFVREAFIEMPSDRRKALQYALSVLGLYSSTIDGRWGPGTAAAFSSVLSDKRNLLTSDETPTIKSLAVAKLYLSKAYDLSMETEGDECDGCNEQIDDEIMSEHEADEAYYAELKLPLIEEPVSDKKNNLDYFKALDIQCRSLPQSSFTTANTASWDAYGDRSIMFHLQKDNTSLNEQRAFNDLVALADLRPNFPPLQFWVGFGYYLRNDFEKTVYWLGKSAEKGEPNSAYLLSVIALNLLSDEDPLKLDVSFDGQSVDAEFAKKCLEVVFFSDKPFVVNGVTHESYFTKIAAELLVPIYLQKEGLLYEGQEQKGFSVSWTGQPNIKRAIEIINANRSSTESCDKNCWKRYEIAAKSLLNEQEEAKKAAAEKERSSLELSSAEMEQLIRKCDSFTTLKSICWAQTSNEQERVLATKGYTCSDEADLFGLKQRICKSGNMRIEISPNIISFNCQNFNTCDYQFNEVAELLIKNGIIPELDYQNRLVGDGVSTFFIEEYCGRGKSADELCVTKDITLLGIPIVSVTIAAGASREDAPSFD